MDFNDTPKQAEFRAKCRDWLDANANIKDESKPKSISSAAENDLETIIKRAKDWQKKKYEAGWAMLHWPEEYGGINATPIERIIWTQEQAKFDVPGSIFEIGLGMCGPVLMEYATEEQKKRYLPPMAEGKEIWCQLFSEPSAGSDVAGLRSKAEKDGDDWIINGQKVWTSYANECDMIFTLVRTGPQEPKHDGISFLLIDMDQSGVETKPIKLISGNSPFCETFFTDAIVPKKNLVHKLNKGWDVAKNLLQHERKMLASMGLGGSKAASKGKTGSGLATLSKKYVEVKEDKIVDEGLRQKIAKCDMNAHAFSLTLKRASEEAKNSNHGPSAATSIFKLYGSEHNKQKYEIMLEAMGTQGLGWEGGEFGPEELAITREWLRTKANSIEGGTSEVQLNVISKRVLDLPQ